MPLLACLTLAAASVGCTSYALVGVVENGGDRPPFAHAEDLARGDLAQVQTGDALALLDGNVSALVHSNTVRVDLMEPVERQQGPSKQERKEQQPSKEERKARQEEAQGPSKEEQKEEEPSKEEQKEEEPSKEERRADEPSKEEEKAEQPSKEERRADEPSKEEEKGEEPSKEEEKAAQPSKEDRQAAELSKEERKAGGPSKEERKAEEPSKDERKAEEREAAGPSKSESKAEEKEPEGLTKSERKEAEPSKSERKAQEPSKQAGKRPTPRMALAKEARRAEGSQWATYLQLKRGKDSGRLAMRLLLYNAGSGDYVGRAHFVDNLPEGLDYLGVRRLYYMQRNSARTFVMCFPIVGLVGALMPEHNCSELMPDSVGFQERTVDKALLYDVHDITVEQLSWFVIEFEVQVRRWR